MKTTFCEIESLRSGTSVRVKYSLAGIPILVMFVVILIFFVFRKAGPGGYPWIFAVFMSVICGVGLLRYPIRKDLFCTATEIRITTLCALGFSTVRVFRNSDLDTLFWRDSHNRITGGVVASTDEKIAPVILLPYLDQEEGEAVLKAIERAVPQKKVQM